VHDLLLELGGRQLHLGSFRSRADLAIAQRCVVELTQTMSYRSLEALSEQPGALAGMIAKWVAGPGPGPGPLGMGRGWQ
jgi:hypothetical protein